MTSTRISETPKLPIALSLNPGVEKPQPPEFEEGNWRGWATVSTTRYVLPIQHTDRLCVTATRT